MGTKIVVIKLKEVIKTGVLAFIGLLIICLIIYLFIPKNNNMAQATYNPGTYASEIILHNNPVLVEVTVSSNEILNIELLNMNETQEVFYPLFGASMEELTTQIIHTQETNIYSSADTSTTNEILIKAVENALNQAKVS